MDEDRAVNTVLDQMLKKKVVADRVVNDLGFDDASKYKDPRLKMELRLVLVVFTTANFGGFSNFCRYYTRSQTGKSTGYRPTLKPLINTIHVHCRSIFGF
jgi:hypothetical protein